MPTLANDRFIPQSQQADLLTVLSSSFEGSSLEGRSVNAFRY